MKKGFSYTPLCKTFSVQTIKKEQCYVYKSRTKKYYFTSTQKEDFFFSVIVIFFVLFFMPIYLRFGFSAELAFYC